MEKLVRASSDLVTLPTIIGGLVSDALNSVYVDALGDFNAGQPGCSEAINAKLDSILGTSDSVYVFGTTRFIKVVFGYGTYALNGTIVRSGVTWVGQGDYGTRLIPTAGDSNAMFITVGTKPFDYNGVRVWERLMYFSFKDFIVGQYWEERNEYPAGISAFDIKYASYGYFQNVRFRRIKAEALGFSEVFDTYYDNVSIMYSGDNSNPSALVHSLRMDKSGSHDATNACLFQRLHMEANHTGMRLNACRHMIFSFPKFERDETSHLLEGCQGVVFDTAEQTWNSNDDPQFLVRAVTGASPSDSWGVKFIGGELISSGGIGLYFRNTAQAGPLVLESISARGVTTVVDGVNWVADNVDTYDCGPTIFKASMNCKLKNSSLLACRKAAVGDGTDDTVLITGANCSVVNTEFTGLSNGGAIPNGAFINSTAVSGAVITGNTYGGYRQYGHRVASNTNSIRDNRINIANNFISALSNLASNNYTFTNKNTRGLGIGEVDSEIVTVAAGATVTRDKVGGCTEIRFRVIPSGGTAASGIVLVDSSNTGIQAMANTNSAVLDIGNPVAGSGKFHVSKPLSGNTVTLTNNLAVSAQVVLLYITAHAS